MKSVLLAIVAVALAAAETPADQFRMNQVQVLGSHNSYKQAIDPSLLKLLLAKHPQRYQSLEYEHVTLSKQLDVGLRKLEIDVVYDPQGGRYAHPLGIRLVKDAGLPAGPKYDPEGLMMKPGLKVLHVPDIDFRSHVYTFKQALRELKAWSDAHPRHLPILITMNAKDGGADDAADFAYPLPFDKEAFDSWDAEIRDILPANKLLTPDDVRGDFNTLEEAALAHAWPTLGEARSGDYSTMKAAFASGAQFVSTDYYYANEKFASGYQVKLPGGGPGRWNPLLVPPIDELPPLE